MSFGITELAIILVIVLLLFGTTKLKSLGSDLGSAIKGFKSAISDDKATDDKSGDITPDTGAQVTPEVMPEANPEAVDAANNLASHVTNNKPGPQANKG